MLVPSYTGGEAYPVHQFSLCPNITNPEYTGIIKNNGHAATTNTNSIYDSFTCDQGTFVRTLQYTTFAATGGSGVTEQVHYAYICTAVN